MVIQKTSVIDKLVLLHGQKSQTGVDIIVVFFKNLMNIVKKEYVI